MGSIPARCSGKRRALLACQFQFPAQQRYSLRRPYRRTVWGTKPTNAAALVRSRGCSGPVRSFQGCSSVAKVFLALWLASLTLAADLPPKRYNCVRADSPIHVDGKLNDAAWRRAAWTDWFLDI